MSEPLVFHYKDLSNTIKLSWAQMNQNIRSVEEAVVIVQDAELNVVQLESSASASADEAASSATNALSDKEAAGAANSLAQAAKDTAVDAKDTAVSAKDTAVQANTDAQAAKNTAVTAKDASVSAKDTAVSARNTATHAADTATGAANAATTKASEANQSAIDAKYWAGESKESASAVTSVQGKQGVVSLVRTDFSWMGDASERNVGTGAGQLLAANNAFGLGAAGLELSDFTNVSIPNGFYRWSTSSANRPTVIGETFGTAIVTGTVGGGSSNHRSRILVGLNSDKVWVQRSVNMSPWSTPVELYHTGNLPQATQAELNAGTQTAPRLFSPKQIAAIVPAGTVIVFAAENAPEGYLKCNGALVSRSAYSNLFANIGTTFGEGDGSSTFALPDLRGEFVRGWQDGRAGVDGSRSLGSYQADSFRSHAHTFPYLEGTASGQAFQPVSRSSLSGTGLTKTTNSSGGVETRPRNVALLYCIKY